MGAVLARPVFASGAGGGGAGTLLRTFTVQETTGTNPLPTGSYISGFAAFPAGAIPSGSKPELRKADGTTALAVQQFDAIKTNAAGDTLLGAWTFKTEDAIAAGAEAAIKAYKTSGSLSNTSALTSAGITGSHAYAVEAVDAADGLTYTALLSDYIDGSDSTVVCSGAACKEWEVFGPLKNAGTDHAKLWATFHVRLHEDGTTVAISAKLTNSYVEAGAAIALTSCALKDGVTTIDSYASITLPPNSNVVFGKSGAPWNDHWSANEPAFHVKYDMAEMEDGCLIFEMLNNAGLITEIGTAPVPVAYDPDDPDQFFDGLGQQDATGSHFYLGQLMRDDGRALVTQDYAWHQYALSKHIYSNLASMHFHEKTGFYRPVLNNLHLNYSLGPDRKSVGVGAGANLTLTGRPSLFSLNSSHNPSWGFYPYITTGRRKWLNEVKDHVIGLLLALNPNNAVDSSLTQQYVRNPTFNGTKYYAFGSSMSNNMRGMAWFQMMLDNAAYLNPDDDADHDYFDDLLNVTHWPAMADLVAANIADDANRETLGLIEYSYGSASEKSLDATWQSGFMAFSTSMAILRGHIDTTHAFVTHHMVKYQIGRFLNGCAYNACTYNMTVATGADDTGTNPLITSWDEAYVGDGASNTWNPMTPVGGCPLTGFNPLWPYTNGASPDPESYPAIAHASLKALNKAGVAGADTALAYFSASGEAGTDAQWAKGPQFGLA